VNYGSDPARTPANQDVNPLVCDNAQVNVLGYQRPDHDARRPGCPARLASTEACLVPGNYLFLIELALPAKQ